MPKFWPWRGSAPTTAVPGDVGLDPQGGLLYGQTETAPRRGSARMYSGARPSRLISDFPNINSRSSADSEMQSSLARLRALSRALCRDVSYAKRAKSLVVNNIIGSGIRLQAQVYTTRDQLNSRVNSEIEACWDEWSEAESCHTGGRLDFASFERALMAQIFEAGEVFVRKHYRRFGDSTIPFALELIEAERIADDMVPPTMAGVTGTDIRMGIEVDEFYRPIAYYIRRRHQNDIRFTLENLNLIDRIPADEIIHLATSERWPQTRGEPWMSATLKTFSNAAGYVEAEITRARVQAATPWVIETPEAAASFGEEQSDGSYEMSVEPGIAKRLNPGEEFKAPGTNSPNPSVEPFMRYLLRDMAAGTGPSYESLSRDYSQSNFSSSRLALLDDRDLWRAWQSWFIKNFREPVHCEWMQQASLAGAFTTFTVEQYALDPEKFESARFRPRGWGWVDPVKEVEANRTAIRCGLMTQQDALANSGWDVEEVIEQRKKELEMAKEAGLIFDTDPAVLAPKLSIAGTEAPATPASTDSKPSDMPADMPSDMPMSDGEKSAVARIFRIAER